MQNQKALSRTSKHTKTSKKVDISSKSFLDEFDAPLPAQCVDLRPFCQVDQQSQFIIYEDKSDEEKMNQLLYNQELHSLQKIMDACNFDQQIVFSQQKIGNYEESPSISSKQSSPIQNIMDGESSWKRQTPIKMEQKQKNEELSPSKVRIVDSNKKLQVIKSQQFFIKERENKAIQKESNIQSNLIVNLNIRENIIISNQKKDKIIAISKKQANHSKKNKKKITKVKEIICKVEEEEFIQSSFVEQNSNTTQKNQNLNYQCRIRKQQKQGQNFKVKQQQLLDKQKLLTKLKFQNKKNKNAPNKAFSHSNDIQNPNNQKQKNIDKTFSLINQYSDLAFIMGLIEELITIYDKGYLFRFSLDFQSDQDDYETQRQPQKTIIIPKNKAVNYFKKDIEKIKKTYSLYQKQRLARCLTFQDRVQLQKEIKFENSDFFINNASIIKQLRPYMKKLSMEEKQLFISFKQDLLQVKDLIQHYEKSHVKSDQHICRICGQEFQNGRQLGGHMSRKHPGKSYEYGMKRESHKTKAVQRIRRQYFKAQQKFNQSKLLQNVVKIEYED